jgi:hypothetical protein
MQAGHCRACSSGCQQHAGYFDGLLRRGDIPAVSRLGLASLLILSPPVGGLSAPRGFWLNWFAAKAAPTNVPTTIPTPLLRSRLQLPSLRTITLEGLALHGTRSPGHGGAIY